MKTSILLYQFQICLKQYNDIMPFFFLHSYLSGGTQTVVINNQISGAPPVSYAVPQGSILGPLLFSLYIFDFHKY